MGAMAGMWAEASAATFHNHRDCRGWYSDIVEAVQVHRAARRQCLRRETGGERSYVSGRAVQCALVWEWSPHYNDLNTQVYSLTGLGKRHRDTHSDLTERSEARRIF